MIIKYNINAQTNDGIAANNTTTAWYSNNKIHRDDRCRLQPSDSLRPDCPIRTAAEIARFSRFSDSSDLRLRTTVKSSSSVCSKVSDTLITVDRVLNLYVVLSRLLYARCFFPRLAPTHYCFCRLRKARALNFRVIAYTHMCHCKTRRRTRTDCTVVSGHWSVLRQL